MPAVGGPGAARRGRVRGATWTAENRLRFCAESDGGTTTSKSQRWPYTAVEYEIDRLISILQINAGRLAP